MPSSLAGWSLVVSTMPLTAPILAFLIGMLYRRYRYRLTSTISGRYQLAMTFAWVIDFLQWTIAVAACANCWAALVLLRRLTLRSSLGAVNDLYLALAVCVGITTIHLFAIFVVDMVDINIIPTDWSQMKYLQPFHQTRHLLFLPKREQVGSYRPPHTLRNRRRAFSLPVATHFATRKAGTLPDMLSTTAGPTYYRDGQLRSGSQQAHTTAHEAPFSAPSEGRCDFSPDQSLAQQTNDATETSAPRLTNTLSPSRRLSQAKQTVDVHEALASHTDHNISSPRAAHSKLPEHFAKDTHASEARKQKPVWPSAGSVSELVQRFNPSASYRRPAKRSIHGVEVHPSQALALSLGCRDTQGHESIRSDADPGMNVKVRSRFESGMLWDWQ